MRHVQLAPLQLLDRADAQLVQLACLRHQDLARARRVHPDITRRVAPLRARFVRQAHFLRTPVDQRSAAHVLRVDMEVRAYRRARRVRQENIRREVRQRARTVQRVRLPRRLAPELVVRVRLVHPHPPVLLHVRRVHLVICQRQVQEVAVHAWQARIQI